MYVVINETNCGLPEICGVYRKELKAVERCAWLEEHYGEKDINSFFVAYGAAYPKDYDGCDIPYDFD